MNRQAFLLACATLLAVPSCKDEGKADEGKADAKGADEKKEAKADGKAEDGKADGKADGKTDAKADAKADGGTNPAANAAGGGVVPADAITECPKSLSGKDEVSRVITKACGVVPVTGAYKMEGGSLILEAGATLAFADGAKLQVGYSTASKLIVRGTKEEPVTLTASGDKVAGVWDGVQIYQKGARSSIAHAVIEWAGNKNQALLIGGEDISVEGLTVRGAKDVAVRIDDNGTLAKFDGNTFEDVGTQVVRLHPGKAGAIGKTNTWPEGGVVQVLAGRVDADVTWGDIGVPWHVTGKVQVRGESGNRATLTIEAGNELTFDGDARVEVGYSGEGTLTANGTKDAPIVLRSDEKTEAGAWTGLDIYGKGEAEISHAVFRHAGKDENHGALYADGDAHLSLSDSTFEDTTVGVVIKSNTADIRKFEKNTFKNTPKAMVLAARQLGKLAGDNVYEGEPVIELLRDRIDADTTWALQKGARVEVNGRVQILGGRLTIAAGSKLHIKDGEQIEVGYSDTGGLEMVGTAEAPIELVGTRDEPGAWKSVIFYGKARGNKIEHVKLRNAGGTAALEFKNDSDGVVKNVSCDKCSAPALTWTCKAKVEQADVTGTDGTPKPIEAPVCK